LIYKRNSGDNYYAVTYVLGEVSLKMETAPVPETRRFTYQYMRLKKSIKWMSSEVMRTLQQHLARVWYRPGHISLHLC